MEYGWLLQYKKDSLSHRNWHPNGGFRKDSSNNADSDKSQQSEERIDVSGIRDTEEPGSVVCRQCSA